LYSNYEGNANCAFGSEALNKNSSGDYNSAFGRKSVFNNTSGNFNIGIGPSSLYENTDGHHNIGIGTESLMSNTNGDYNSAFGSYSNNLVSGFNNSAGFGYNSDPTASDKVRIGNGSITSIGGAVAWSNLSDQRFKTNIGKAEVKGLEFILLLEPTTYNYDLHAYERWVEANYGEVESGTWETKYDIEKIQFSGFIAQEVEEAAQSIEYDFSGVDKPKNDKDVYALRYAEFVVPLVKGMQEQQEIIENQQEEILALKNKVGEIDQLKAEIENIKSMLEMRAEK